MTKTIRSQFRSHKLTPDLAAKQFAAANPTAAGTLEVASYTPAGAGGWQVKTKHTLFYILHGRSTRTIHSRIFTATWVNVGVRNGVCGICGGLFLEPAIREYTTADGWITEACPLCSVERKLLTPDGSLRHGRHPDLEQWTRWGTPTPAAALRGVSRVYAEYQLDIRPAQSNVGVQLAQTAPIILGA